MGRYYEAPEVGKGRHSHHGQRSTCDVDYFETLERQVANLAHLVQHMLSVPAIKLEVHQLQPLQAGETVEKILHVLENHSSRPVDLNLVIGFCKVTRENIGETLDVWKLYSVDVAPSRI